MSVDGVSGAGSTGAVALTREATAGDCEGVETKQDSSSDRDTKAVEMTGGLGPGSEGVSNVQMSTQDFCTLRTQAAQPAEESQGVDLQKLLEWLMAIKMLEAMGENGGNQ